MTRADAETFWVGQPVKVHSDGRRSTAQDGEIVRVGRDLVDIQTGTRVRSFRIKGQRLNGDQTGVGTTFRTLDQTNESRRRRSATEIIKRHGLLIALTSQPLSTEKLEAIAEFLEELC